MTIPIRNLDVPYTWTYMHGYYRHVHMWDSYIDLDYGRGRLMGSGASTSIPGSGRRREMGNECITERT